jgi:pseudouridine-5'-monophosphatase
VAASRVLAVHAPRGTLRSVRAVIFDLDGTLLNTEPFIDEANAAILGRYGAKLTNELRRELRGRTRQDNDRTLAETIGPLVTVEEVSRARSALLEGAWERVELMPGAARLLARLLEQGTPMALATSSFASAVAAKLVRHEGLRAAMRVMVYGDHPAVRRPKPAPDIFLVAAAELGVEPAACLVFEDAPSGVRAAVAAGMRVVAVPERSMRDDPAFGEATSILESLDEVDPSSW